MKKIIIVKLLLLLLKTVSKFTPNTVDDNIALVGDHLMRMGEKLIDGDTNIEVEITAINDILKGIK